MTTLRRSVSVLFSAVALALCGVLATPAAAAPADAASWGAPNTGDALAELMVSAGR